MKHLQIIFLTFSLLNAGYSVQDRALLIQHREVKTAQALDLRPKIESKPINIKIIVPEKINFVSDSLMFAAK